MANVRAQGRIRIPLALLVSRYFLYAIIGAVVAVGIPLGAAAWYMVTGAVLTADYGEAHWEETAEALSDQAAFDSESIPSAYRYARFDADGALVSYDMTKAQVKTAQAIAQDPDFATPRPLSAGAPTFFVTFELPDRGSCVLCYDLNPQWKDKGLRDTLPNPQTLFVWSTLATLVLVISLVAMRASRVLTRKMAPLVKTAENVGRQDLDRPAESSNVAEIDDVLCAMESMRASLSESIRAQRAAEQRNREQVAALAHDLKTPLTVVLGNTELLMEEASLKGADADQLACLQAIRDSASTMDAFVNRIVEASREHAEELQFKPVNPADLADALEESMQKLVAAFGLVAKTSRDAAFLHACASAAKNRLKPPLWDAEAIERATLNLVSNACGHAKRTVALSIDCDAHEQEVRISVDDDGPGFSPEALERGTERLFRDDASRVNSRRGIDGTHFGLGLSIAQGVAAAHNGRLELTNPTDAEGHISGGRATLVLPLRPRH